MTLNKKDDFGKIIGILASIATIIGTCIALIALIPAFGQWLSPKDQSIIIQPTFTPVANFYPTQTEETFITPTVNNLTTNTPTPTTIIPTNIPVEPKIIEQTVVTPRKWTLKRHFAIKCSRNILSFKLSRGQIAER